MTRKTLTVREIFSQPRFMVSPEFLQKNSDNVTCHKCGKKALRYIGVWAERDHHNIGGV